MGGAVHTLWDELETWARTHAGRSLHLRPGVPPERIDEAEKAMGVTFPSDLRESFLHHDGQDLSAGEPFAWLPGCSPLAPLEAVVERWRDEGQWFDEDDGADHTISDDGLLHDVVGHPRRIPIAGNEWWDGDNTYVDLFPGPHGSSGQVITFVSECDLVVMGSSLREALEDHLHCLRSGAWVVEGGVVRPKGAARDAFPHTSELFAARRGRTR
ncbi:SMI1/KNR4 family protein [Streptomyces sp. NPDC059851]|uniref:SMI1/KNR4 family protein n=1 Tax=Streptomyces sp. NPDC059851 TaxID=3346971 RepID=UPI003652DE53